MRHCKCRSLDPRPMFLLANSRTWVRESRFYNVPSNNLQAYGGFLSCLKASIPGSTIHSPFWENSLGRTGRLFATFLIDAHDNACSARSALAAPRRGCVMSTQTTIVFKLKRIPILLDGIC